MQSVFQLPEAFKDDPDRLEEQTERYKRGEISAAEYRSFRVPLGIYEQREAGRHMLRVRFPAGQVLPQQMRTLAAVARQYGNGTLHVTTRQDIQVHRVPLENVPAAFRRLHQAGLSSRGGGGNTVRNITGCYDAGVCADEEFNLSPYAVALTEFLLPDPLSYQLPRKYKIALSGCPKDCAGATVNDVGLIAKRRGGVDGFRVYVGGGMGANYRLADLLEEFVPGFEIHLVAEAIKRVFDKHGNRKNRQKARLRFLVERIGFEQLRKLYQSELAALKSNGVPELRLRPEPQAPARGPCQAAEPVQGFETWCRRATRAQKQPGYFLVHVPLFLGDLSSETMEKLADVVERHGEGCARTTQQQNLVLRWVHETELPGLHAELKSLGLAAAEPPVLTNLVACAGAATCKLGICLSRGLATACRHKLQETGLDLHGLGDLHVYISGCPNACGRHPVGQIGFSGAARRIKGRLVPHYVLYLGGRIAEGKSRFAERAKMVPARFAPALLADLLQGFQQSAQYPDFHAFVRNGGRALAEELAARYRDVPDFDTDPTFYCDWGSDQPFSLAGRGPGECGAGVFDMIEVDLASAREAVEQDRRYDAVVLAARALLVTRGVEGHNDAEILDLFRSRFIQERLVDDRFTSLVDRARQAAVSTEPAKAFDAQQDEARQLVQAVQQLYENMDSSLRFKPVTGSTEPASGEPAEAERPESGQAAAVAAEPAEHQADLRGVACPLNYVKTKMLLDQLPSGAVLSVLLDGDGVQSVPESVQKNGHQVLAVEQEGDDWRVRICKK